MLLLLTLALLGAAPTAAAPPGDADAESSEAGPRAIARWDTVPYQTIDDKLAVGVLAFHIDGIDRVELSCNGGPWLPVREMSLNPQTGVAEYWAMLSATDFPEDGPIEVRATAYPREGRGRPRELPPLRLSSNARRTLKSPVRYVAPPPKDLLERFRAEQKEEDEEKAAKAAKEGEAGGSADSGDEAATAERDAKFKADTDRGRARKNDRDRAALAIDADADGSPEKPYHTLAGAALSIAKESSDGTADGGILYLLPGDHGYGPGLDKPPKTAHRWLTIAPAPGVDPTKVRLTRSLGGMITKLVHVQNVAVAPEDSRIFFYASGPMEDQLWLDHCDLHGPNRGTEINWFRGWTDVYATDCAVGRANDGLREATLQRNVVVDDIGSDAFTGTKVIVNCRASNIDKRGMIKLHPDVVQYGKRTENVIIYGLTAVDNIGAQGVFGDPNTSMTDAAFINVQLSNRTSDNRSPGYRAFLFMGPVQHMLIEGSTFTGPARFPEKAPVRDVVVVNQTSTFPMGLERPAPSGVRFR
jgi:hypothetical protein